MLVLGWFLRGFWNTYLLRFSGGTIGRGIVAGHPEPSAAEERTGCVYTPWPCDDEERKLAKRQMLFLLVMCLTGFLYFSVGLVVFTVFSWFLDGFFCELVLLRGKSWPSMPDEFLWHINWIVGIPGFSKGPLLSFQVFSKVFPRFFKVFPRF